MIHLLSTADYYWWTSEFYTLNKVWCRGLEPNHCWFYQVNKYSNCNQVKTCSAGYDGCKNGAECYDKAYTVDDKMCNCKPGWKGEACDQVQEETTKEKYTKLRKAREALRKEYGQ